MALSLVAGSRGDPLSRHDRVSKEHEVAIISRRLGLDIRADIELAWIVQEYQTAALPPGWKVIKGDQGTTFYENALSRVTTIDNPIEPRFRELVKHFKSQKHQGLPADEITVLELLEPIERPADVADMADWMGISRELEPHLMWIAKLAVLESLPEGWEEGVDDAGRPIFRQTGAEGVVTHNHPGDAAFQALLQRERRKRVPYLSVQQCVFDTPMVHFRNEFLEDGTELRIQVLPNSGEWMDFYDAYGERYWYHLGKNKVTTDINVVRRVPAAETIQRVWRGHVWRRVLHRMHAAALRIGGFWRLRHFKRGLSRTRAARLAAATRLQRFWLGKKACVLASHSVFLKLTEIGQRSRLAMRRRLLTAGLQSTGRTFLTVRRATVRIQQSFRDYQVRKLLFDPQGHKTRAAMLIQHGMRRYREMVRRKAQLEVERRARLARQLSAVRLIQRAWRNFKVRRRYLASMTQFAEEHEQRKRAHRQQQLSRLASGNAPTSPPTLALAGAPEAEDLGVETICEAELAAGHDIVPTTDDTEARPPPPPPGVAPPPPQAMELAAASERATSGVSSRSSSRVSSPASLPSTPTEPPEPAAPPAPTQATRPRDMSSMIRPVTTDVVAAPRLGSALGAQNVPSPASEVSPEDPAVGVVVNVLSAPMVDNIQPLTASASAAPQGTEYEPRRKGTGAVKTGVLEACRNHSSDAAGVPVSSMSLAPAIEPEVNIDTKLTEVPCNKHSEAIGHDRAVSRPAELHASARDHTSTAPRLALEPEGWTVLDRDEVSDEDQEALDLMRMDLEPLIEEDEEEAAMEEAAMEEAAMEEAAMEGAAMPNERAGPRAQRHASTTKAAAPVPPARASRQRPTSAVLSRRSPYAKSSINPRPASAARSGFGTSKEDTLRSVPVDASHPILQSEYSTDPLEIVVAAPTPSTSHEEPRELPPDRRMAFDTTPPAQTSRPVSGKPQTSTSANASRHEKGVSVPRKGVREAWGRPESAKTMELKEAALQVERLVEGSRGRVEYAPNVGVEVVVHSGDTPARTPAPSVGTTPRVRSAAAPGRLPASRSQAAPVAADAPKNVRSGRLRPASAVVEKKQSTTMLKGRTRPSSAAEARSGPAQPGYSPVRAAGKIVANRTTKAVGSSARETSVVEAALAKVSAAAEMLGRSRPSNNGGNSQALTELQEHPPRPSTHPPTDPTIDMLRSALRGTSSLSGARPVGEGAALPSISKQDHYPTANVSGQRRGSTATAMSGYNMARDPLNAALQTAKESRRRSGRDAFGAPGEDEIQRLLKATLIGSAERSVTVAPQRKNSTTTKQNRRSGR